MSETLVEEALRKRTSIDATQQAQIRTSNRAKFLRHSNLLSFDWNKSHSERDSTSLQDGIGAFLTFRRRANFEQFTNENDKTWYLGSIWDLWGDNTVSFNNKDTFNHFDGPFTQLDADGVFGLCDPRSDLRTKRKTPCLPSFGHNKTDLVLSNLSIDQSEYINILGVPQGPTKRSRRLVGHPASRH